MELVDKLSNRQYIDGEWVESSNKNTRDIINPYNQETIFTFSFISHRIKVRWFPPILNLVITRY